MHGMMRLTFCIQHCGRFLVLAGVLLWAAACDRPPQTPHDLLAAREAYRIQDYYTAELAYKRYLQKNSEAPERWEAWKRLSDMALVRADNHEAVELLHSMALEFSADREKKKRILERLSAVYESERQWMRAAQTLTELLEIPGLPPEEQGWFVLRLGRAYKNRRENEQALEAFRTCSEPGASSDVMAQCLLSLGLLHLDMDDQMDAEKAFARLEKLSGVSEDYKAMALFSMADYMESKGKLEEALVLFRRVMPLYPNPAAAMIRVESLEKQLEKP